MPATGAPLYGNLYNNLLEYVVFAVLVFYVLTIAALFVLRRTRPHDDRPYRAPGYPILPALYILGGLHHRRRALPVSHRNLAAGIPHRPERAARVRAVAALRIGDRVTTAATTTDRSRTAPPIACSARCASWRRRSLAGRPRSKKRGACRRTWSSSSRRSASSGCSCRDAGAVSRSTFRRASRSSPSSPPRTARWAGPR